MADRYCPACGTEVDADARFCPSCGITLEEDAQPERASAPAWPEPASPDPAPAQAVPEEEAPPPAAREEEAPPPPPAPPAGEAASPAAQPAVAAPAGIDLPFTWPTTASGWLIGVGSAVGAVALIPRLSDLLSVLLFLALLGVVASIFLAERMPEVPRLRLLRLVIVTIGLGIALDRSAFTVRGLETILLLGMLAAAGGALLIELDRDRPLPPPGGSDG
jgi:zinc ribbon protein